MSPPSRVIKTTVEEASRAIAASRSYTQAAKRLGVTPRTLFSLREQYPILNTIPLVRGKQRAIKPPTPVSQPASEAEVPRRAAQLPPAESAPMDPSPLDLPGRSQIIADVSDEEITEKLVETAGNISLAARLLGVESGALRYRVHRSPTLHQSLREQDERTADMMETRLRQIALRGKTQDGTPATRASLAAIQQYLTTKGANRGYVQAKVSLTTEDQRMIFRVFLDSISGLPAEEQKEVSKRWERRWLDAASSAGVRWAQDESV